MNNETCYQCEQPAVTTMRAGRGFPDIDVPLCEAHTMQRKAEWALGTSNITFTTAPSEGVVPQGRIIKALDAIDNDNDQNYCRVVSVEGDGYHVI